MVMKHPGGLLLLATLVATVTVVNMMRGYIILNGTTGARWDRATKPELFWKAVIFSWIVVVMLVGESLYAIFS